MYLVEFTKSSGKLIIEDDGVYAIPEFLDIITSRGMGEPMMRCVALLCDYMSPYRYRPEEERHIAIARDIFGKDKEKKFNLKNEKINLAIIKYNYLQYDPYRDELVNTRNTIQKLVQLKNALKVEEENLAKIKSYISSIQDFEKRIEQLKKVISESENEGPVALKLSLSRLEQKLENEQNGLLTT